MLHKTGSVNSKALEKIRNLAVINPIKMQVINMKHEGIFIFSSQKIATVVKLLMLVLKQRVLAIRINKLF